MLISSLSNAQSIRPVNDRIDAIVFHPLVIPIRVEQENLFRKPIITKLDDGRLLESIPYWVGITPNSSRNSWTKSTGIWTATPYSVISKLPQTSRPLGAWFTKIPLPIDAVGQGLWFEGQRYELNWLSDPERSMLETSTKEHAQAFSEFWSVALDQDALDDPSIIHALDQYEHNPFEYWRAMLITNGLDPQYHHMIESSISLEQLEQELDMNAPGAEFLRDIADQGIARWQIILGRIWLIDPIIAHRLKSRLLHTFNSHGRTFPLWTEDIGDLDQLAQDLLSPYINDETRSLRAKAWLDIQPRAIARVVDDQGTIEPITERFLPTLEIISIPSTQGVSLFQIDSPNRPEFTPELVTIDALEPTQVSFPIEPIHISPTHPHIETLPIRARVGHWRNEHHVIASPTPAKSPHITIGPLLYDWTMSALFHNKPNERAAPLPEHSTIGLLRKVSTPSRSNHTQGWQLYLELGSHTPTSPDESLEIWVGPFQRSLVTWTITPLDQLINIEHGSTHNRSKTIGIPQIQTRVFDDRWIAIIDLPSDAFDEQGRLQIGIKRTDANKNHSAWPRRMIPDQPEPGRLIFESHHYNQLKE